MVGPAVDRDKTKSTRTSHSQSSGTGQTLLEDQDSNSGGDDEDIAEDDNTEESKPAVPVQKRRRVTRACDECRRKKIKCDGKQPCTHCTVYSYGLCEILPIPASI